MALALFDLDETLLPVDSDYLWATFMVGKGYIADQDFMQKKDIFKKDYMAGRLDIYAYIAFVAKYLNRLGLDREYYQEEFINEVIRPNISDAALSLVSRHREAGDATLIITATNDFIVTDVMRFFKVDYLISTELETVIREGELYYTGKPKGIPSFREGKVRRVEDFLRNHPEHSWSGSYFYSDSKNDLPLLKKVDNPKAVNPDLFLKKEAKLRGWEIIDLHGKGID